MPTLRIVVTMALAAAVVLQPRSSAAPGRRPLQVRVTLSEQFQVRTSGRLLVLLAKGSGRNQLEFAPPSVDTWIAAREVKALTPGGDVWIDVDDIAFPTPFSQAPAGDYQIQAFLDTHHTYAYTGLQPGDLVGEPRSVMGWAADAVELPALTIDREVPQVESALPAAVRPIRLQSAALTAFWGRRIDMTGYVVLPPSYSATARTKYPTAYWTHGFGGTLQGIAQTARQRYELMASKEIPEMIWVILNQSFSTGTIEFADSVNSGPWGLALTRELIPTLERQYRMEGTTTGRFLTGHSSGGWAALWLQVSYPDMFGGAWGTAPDSSDFRSVNGPDIYAPHANVYRRSDGTQWPLLRMNGREVMSLQQFAGLEAVLGEYGGQLASLEWVFSPKGSDGRPMPLFDRVTGDVDPVVAAYWGAHYDIARKVVREWPRIGDDLRGKIHVIVGDADTFHLDAPARLLDGVLHRLGAKATFTYAPGKSHFDLYADGPDRQALTKKIATEMYAISRGRR